MKLIWGESSYAEEENDILWLIEQGNKSDAPKPLLYQCCGTEDFLYEDNLTFKAACEKTSYSHTYSEGPGIHDWAYWDRTIQDVLAWLPLKK